MANGLTLNMSLAYSGNNVTVADSVVNQAVVVTGNGVNSRKGYSAPTADTAIPLGSVSAAGGFLYVKNNDPTNYVQVKTAVAGTVIAKLTPNNPALMIPLDPSITAPSTQANTAPCSIDFAIFDL